MELRASRPALSPLAAELRTAAPDRFLTALFAPAPLREAMMALAGFEAATARATQATQTLAGLARLAFWRDAIAGAGDGRMLSHPVADALRAAIVVHRLPGAPFEAHLAAREAMLTGDGFADLEALCDHAREVALPMLSLACRVLDRPVPQAAERAATALGLVALLREAILLARAGHLALPADLCSAAGFGAQSLAEGRNRARIAGVVEAVADAAGEALRGISVPRGAAVAFLPLVPARGVLGTLARQGFDPAAAALWQPHTATRLGVLWAAMTGRV